jgi:7,8-dihydropterin-6-yl-methyl-4-(beta-D-ribofuranosyl)aminobenzene 5'-phosphate synthase
MKLKITTLSENTAGRADLVGEYGLSVLIEQDGKKILFDTGQSTSCVKNADAMHVRLDDLDMIILSHGHYDHTGGLKEVLMRTGSIDVYAHPDIFQKKYAVRKDKRRYIGIPFERSELEELGARFKLSRNPCFFDCLILSGEVKRQTSFEHLDPALFVDAAGVLEPDLVLDDQALAIKTSNGLFVVLGCAHSGVVNTMKQLIELSGDDRIYTVIGGTHLGFADDRQIDETVKYLRGSKVWKIGVSHCTGSKGAKKLSEAFTDRFFLNNAGDVIEVL